MSVFVDRKELESFADTSLFHIIQFSWAVAVSNYTDSSHVSFGLLDSSRGRSDIDIVEIDVLPEDRIHDALKRVQQNEDSSSAGSPSAGSSSESSFSTGVETFHSILVIRTAHGLCQEYTPLEEGKDTDTVICTIQSDRIILQNGSGSTGDLKMGSRVLEHWKHILQRMGLNADARVGDLQGISPEEVHLLNQWNSDGACNVTPAERCAHNLIEDQCREQPSAPALHCWDGQLTYSQLDAYASRLALRLAKRGIARGQFVSILMKKSMWTTISILAVMKTGGAFVLLDTSQPIVRLAQMCRRTRSRLVLAGDSEADMASQLGIDVMRVTADLTPEENDIPPTSWCASDVTTEDPIIVGFTSGSTGESKGFLITHGAFASGLEEYSIATNMTSKSRVFQFAPYSFAASITDQIAPLTRGACVCVPSDEQRQNALTTSIRTLRANWLKLPPALLRLLSPDEIDESTTIFIVGEAADTALIAQWANRVKLFSLYGQSENSKGTAVIPRALGKDLREIGRPWAATPWIVSSEDPNRLVPLGADGELLLEGPCLSKGYLDSEEQNRLFFVEDPVWLREVRPSSPRGRFLRTGDLARFSDANGTIQLIGRKNTRVKIRGQRVELTEVEHQLGLHYKSSEPPVADVIVPADQDHWNAMLVAFIPVGSTEGKSDGGLFTPPPPSFRTEMQQLISHLERILPTFMVPAAYIPVANMPRGVTGKLNRRMLHMEAAKLKRSEILAALADGSEYQSPKTTNEVILQRVCADILKLPLESVGMQANFFSLGGDSLTARNLVACLGKHGLNIAVTDVFTQDSLGELAQCESAVEIEEQPVLQQNPFEGLLSRVTAGLLAALAGRKIVDVFPASPYQTAVAKTNEMFFIVYDVEGPLDVPRLEHACQTVVNAHAALRSVFIPFERKTVNVVLQEVETPFQHVVVPEDHHSLADWATDFSKTNLLQGHTVDQPAVLFVIGHQNSHPQRHMLIVRYSHAQCDGPAVNTCVKDIWDVYNTGSMAEPCDLSLYARDFVRERTEATYNFWRDQLQGSTVTKLSLPLGATEERPIWERTLTLPALPHGTSSTIYMMHGGAGLWERQIPLPTMPKGMTLATVLKTAWARVLCTLTNQTDVVFAQIVSGRNTATPGVERLVNCSVDIAPVRVQSSTGSTTRQILRDVQHRQAQSTQFETLRWDEMAGNCTDWEKGEGPCSLLYCQNFQRTIGGESESGLRWRHALQLFMYPNPPNLILETYPNDENLVILMAGPHKLANNSVADRIMDLFSESIRSTCEDPDAMFELNIGQA